MQSQCRGTQCVIAAEFPQRRAAPQAECLLKNTDGGRLVTGRTLGAGLRAEAGELLQIGLDLVARESVRGTVDQFDLHRQGATQSRHVYLQCPAGVGRRGLLPQVIDKRVHGDWLASRQGQSAEQDVLLVAPHRQRISVQGHLHSAQEIQARTGLVGSGHGWRQLFRVGPSMGIVAIGPNGTQTVTLIILNVISFCV